jgi:LPS-assembly lipoprotein
MSVRMVRPLLIVWLTLLLSACGFHLRGDYALPFDTLYIALPSNHPLHGLIKRNIEASSPTRVVDDPKDAAATLVVLSDRQEKNILSLNAAGRAREYELVRKFQFKLNGQNGGFYIRPSQITIRRDMTYSDELVLSKGTEETLIWRDIQNDLVNQLLRRFSAAQLQTPDDDADTF